MCRGSSFPTRQRAYLRPTWAASLAHSSRPAWPSWLSWCFCPCGWVPGRHTSFRSRPQQTAATWWIRPDSRSGSRETPVGHFAEGHPGGAATCSPREVSRTGRGWRLSWARPCRLDRRRAAWRGHPGGPHRGRGAGLHAHGAGRPGSRHARGGVVPSGSSSPWRRRRWPGPSRHAGASPGPSWPRAVAPGPGLAQAAPPCSERRPTPRRDARARPRARRPAAPAPAPGRP